MTANLVFEANDLWKSYGQRAVLKGVSLGIPKGAIVGLVGDNGSGKSTLIKCALGLLRPARGQLTVLGEEAWNLSALAKAKIGYVPQTTRLYPWFTVRQMIRYASAFYPVWNEERVEHSLSQSSLDENQRIGQLSTGQAQQLSILLALAFEPEFLLLDEPAASLDPGARRDVLGALLDIAQDEGRTVLFSTHIMSDLERVASHVAILKDGRISLFEELDTLKDRVKRLRVVAPMPLPDGFKVKGALQTVVEGPCASVSIDGDCDAIVRQLEQEWSATVQVEDLNLEEIYLELVHRRPLAVRERVGQQH